MEEKTQVRASSGSKLPKFGTSKPLGSLLQRPSTRINVLSGKGNLAGIEKHNDPDGPYSLNWPKSKCQQNGQVAKDPPVEKVQDTCVSLSHSVGGKDAPRVVGMAKTSRKQNNTLMSPREDLNENLVSGLPNAAKFTRSSIFGRTSYSALNGYKTQANGFYSSKPPVGLQRPRANSASSRNFPDKPTDNLKSLYHVRRSQSFSHSSQNPLLTSGPLTRSYSFNRDVEITRPYSTQHVPNGVPPKPSLLARTARQYELPNGNESHLKTTFARTFPARLSSGLKAPGLPNGSTAPLSLGYKMNRPSLLRSNRTQFQHETVINGIVSSALCPATGKSEQTHIERAAGDQKQVDKKVPAFGGYVLCDSLDKNDSPNTYYSEDLDELSISSLSSSDKNDLSEDFSDDFVDLEEGNKLVPVGKIGRETTGTPPAEHSLESLKNKEEIVLNKTDDWLANSETESTKSPYGKTRISPDMDYRDHSSLELSPSDSSDGTYMWDEEGMEPIGSVHPCGSYESSEMNSLDILNNLDSCDLEDDDLMLDVDLPEDAPCNSGKGIENMSLLQRTELNLRQQQQAFWKRVPPRQEQYHLINADHYHNGRGSAYVESPTEPDGYISSSFYPPSPRAAQMMGLRENTVMLDEMTLCHMVQDCTSVKTQLLKLKRLLQQEDCTGSTPDLQLSVPTTPEPQETEVLWKTEDLLNEIRQLKEEAQKKDETIKHLEHQLKTRCKCQRAGHDSKAERPKQIDKYTQTSCRRNSPQILQCSSNNILSSTDHPSGKLTAPQHIGDPSEHEEKLKCPSSDSQNGIVEKSFDVSENELSTLLSTQLKIDDVEDKNPKDCKRAEEPSACQVQEPNSRNVGLQKPHSGIPLHSSTDTKNDTQSNLTVKSSSTGLVPRPKTLQLYQCKSSSGSAHQESANPSASLNIYSSCKDPQRSILTSSRLIQSQNGSQFVVEKSQQLTPNSCTTGHPSVREPCNTVSGSSTTSCNSLDLAQTMHNKPEKPSPAKSSSSEVGNSKPSSLSHLQAPYVDPSKTAVKQALKTSMLRPPGNFVSKLKKNGSPKLDTVHPQAPSQENPKSHVKTSSVIPRPLSYKKEEAIENLALKKQSRLPQPNTIRKQ